MKQAIEAHTARAYPHLSTINCQELFPAQLPPPLPGWDTSPPQHCCQWYVKKNTHTHTQNQRPVRGEVKWEIVSWLRSKWLWATKLGKNYVVSKIYIRFLINWIMLTLFTRYLEFKAHKEILFKFVSLPFIFAYVYVIPLMK